MESSDREKSFEAEIEAMRKISEALQGLEESAIKRILQWVGDKFDIQPSPPTIRSTEPTSTQNETGYQNTDRFGDLADFYSEIGPSKDTEKALVVGYWLQHIQGLPDFDSQSVNRELKNLGYGVTNITRAFELLKSKKPALAVQMKKGGTSKQARKRLKLTYEGKRAVEGMLGK